MKIMGEVIPTWVLIGAVILAFCAGILNTTALMGITHISASHVTGNVSLFVVSMLAGDWSNFKLLLISIASFWLGSVLSGAIIGSSELNIRRNYGYAMLLEVLMLCLSLWMYLSEHHFFWANAHRHGVRTSKFNGRHLPWYSHSYDSFDWHYFRFGFGGRELADWSACELAQNHFAQLAMVGVFYRQCCGGNFIYAHRVLIDDFANCHHFNRCIIL